jgi:hypothetical protein
MQVHQMPASQPYAWQVSLMSWLWAAGCVAGALRPNCQSCSVCILLVNNARTQDIMYWVVFPKGIPHSGMGNQAQENGDTSQLGMLGPNLGMRGGTPSTCTARCRTL